MVLKTREMRLRVDFLDLGFDLGEMRLRERERVRATRFDEDIWIWGIGEGPGTAGRRRARRESLSSRWESLKIEGEIMKEAQLHSQK
jgi:hypothetical protein